MASEIEPFDEHDLEEIFAYWPVATSSCMSEKDILDLKHPASATDDIHNPLFILKREKRASRCLPVNLEGRGTFSSGFDFLNYEALDQFRRWQVKMFHSNWWGQRYDSIPITREADALANYCLAFWAHAIQDDSSTLSMHASDKFEGRTSPCWSNGYVLINGNQYALMSSRHADEQLRDVVPALQGAFGLPKEEIAHNLDAPFPRRNIWDIPGGKMLVVPNNYEARYTGVRTIRLIPNQLVDKLQATSRRIIDNE